MNQPAADSPPETPLAIRDRIPEQVDTIYRTESRRVFATLIRLLGDFDLAEEAMHEAFTAAVTQWSRDGMPANPHSWLVSTGRFKAIDTLRRRARFDSFLPQIAPQIDKNDPNLQDEEDVDARVSYLQALELVKQEPERRFLQQRLRELG
jgi:predicted RNA polymerase sigma factor